MFDFRIKYSLSYIINQGIDRALFYEQQRLGDLLSSICDVAGSTGRLLAKKADMSLL